MREDSFFAVRKKYTIRLISNGKVVFSAQKDNVYNRFETVALPGVSFDRLVLTLNEVWDPKRTPGAYEIRVY